jgi:hypothetical protein
VTGRAIVTLAIAATGLLVAGARLLEGSSRAGAILGVLALLAGIALAATVVAGAWRTPERPGEPEAGAARPARRPARARVSS